MVAATALSAPAAPYTPDARTLSGVARVRDGDSLSIGKAMVRLWGVDAPELYQRCERAEGGGDWACGEAAAQALRAHLDHRALRCAVVDRDRYGRSVCRCALSDGRSVNAWLVREGWALDYRRYSQGRYAGEQRAAQAARRGIWSGPFQEPEAYRREHPRDPADRVRPSRPLP